MRTKHKFDVGDRVTSVAGKGYIIGRDSREEEGHYYAVQFDHIPPVNRDFHNGYRVLPVRESDVSLLSVFVDPAIA